MGDVNHKKKNNFLLFPNLIIFKHIFFTPWDINIYALLTTICLKTTFQLTSFLWILKCFLRFFWFLRYKAFFLHTSVSIPH